MFKFGNLVGFLILVVCHVVYGNPGDAILNLDAQITDIPGLGMRYDGSRRISNEEALRLFTLAKGRHDRASLSGPGRCATCPEHSDTPIVASPGSGSGSGSGSGTQWEVVFLMRIGLRTGSGGSSSISPEASGATRLSADMVEYRRLYNEGKLTNEKIDELLTASGNAMSHSPQAAMAYVASLGSQLNALYGDSNAGSFIPRFEQYGRLISGTGSVGQCSDIHFAMLKAYKRLVGPNAKAYLVNFQTASNLHHTNLIIEDQGKINVINYGEIMQNSPGTADLLAQNTSIPGHGLAYRIFTDDGEIDKMVAHVDTPLGKFLREVTTGRSSFNPFESTNYTTLTAGLQSSGGTAVRIFFGELGQGDAVMGVAVDLKGVNRLGAGFTLQSYLSSAIAYTYNTFRTPTSTETLHSGILYINTGLGVVSPKLELRGFTFQARTDLVLEGGVWMKSYSAMDEDDSRFEGDFNLISRTRVDASLQVTRRFRIDAGVEIELIPSFKTAFPSSTDGSSGTDGLAETLGILPNRTTVRLGANYQLAPDLNLFGGVTYQHTPLGGIGQVDLGLATSSFRASAFIRGALDREETPLFIPGAERSVGGNLLFCPGGSSTVTPMACIGANGSHSLENNSWNLGLTGEVRF
ncbi:MAG: hypothetical protein HYV97_15200 [Bdellovibrio sp.]|nr:hypothetical protein [Bdellovibrio sp.]